MVDLSLDAVIIADCEVSSLSGSNPLKLHIEGRTADIQVVLNYVKNSGDIAALTGKGDASWASAPKLNGIYLLGFLRGKNFEVELINNYFQEKDRFCHLLKENPHVVIISTTFIHSKKELRRLVDDIRTLAHDIIVIVGGPFIYSSYLIREKSCEPHYSTDEIKDNYVFQQREEPSVDLYIISLKGETILTEALRRIRRGSPIDDLPNTARLIGGTYQFSQRVNDVSRTENFSIDWKTLPPAIFETGVIPMQASIGCTYRCAFCNFVKDARLAHIRPLDRLLIDLREAAERGIRYVWFLDDNFRLGKRDLNAVSRRLVDEDLGISWMSFIRADTLRNVDFELLRRSGCRELQIGVESADVNILRNMNKASDPKLYADVIRGLLQAGINCSCYFIFGFPGETDETISRTIEFIINLESQDLDGVLSWSIYPFILAPLSPIYEEQMRRKYGLTGYAHHWEHGTMNSQQAREQILRAFLEIENSGPIYRGDDQDLLQSLSPLQRKNFAVNRHKLAKLSIQNILEKNQIIDTFSEIFSERDRG